MDRGRMLHCRRDDVIPRSPLARRPPDGVIVRLAPAAREDHFSRVAPEQTRHLPTGFFHRIFRGHPGPMEARRVPVMIGEGTALIGVHRFRADRRWLAL